MKKKSLSLILGLCLLILCALGLAACGSKDLSVSVTLTGGSENISLDDYPQSVSKGGSAVISVRFKAGYDHRSLSATANGTAVSGTAEYTEGGEMTADVDFSKERTVTFKLTNISEAVNVAIDASNCGLAKIDITLGSALATGAQYAYVKDSVGADDYITTLSSSTVDTVQSVADGKITADYGKRLFLFLDSAVDTVEYARVDGMAQVIFRATVGNKPYLHQGRSVFYVDSVVKQLNFIEFESGVVDGDKGGRANTFNLIAPKLGGVHFSMFTEAVNDESPKEKATVGGVTVQEIGLSGGANNYRFNYMYIGDKASAAEDDTLTDLSNVELVGKRLYIKVSADNDAIIDNLTFSLMPDYKREDLTKIELTSDTDGGKFIVLERTDVEKYITTSSGNSPVGSAVLDCALDPGYISDNFVSFTLDFGGINNGAYPALVKNDTGSTSPAFIGYDGYDNQKFYFYSKDVFGADGSTVDNINIDIGSFTSYKATKADITVKSGDFTNTSSVTFKNSDDIASAYPKTLDLTGATDKKDFEVKVEYSFAPYDDSEHSVDFSALPSGVEMYISSDPLASFAGFTKVTAATKAKISKSATLYYVIKGDTYVSLSAEKNGNTSESMSDMWSDLRGENRSVDLDGVSYSVYALTLIDRYRASEAVLYANFS